MFEKVENSPVELLEDIWSKYEDYYVLYEFVPNDSGFYKGRVLAVSDCENQDKLLALKSEQKSLGVPAKISRPRMGGIIRSTRKVDVY